MRSRVCPGSGDVDPGAPAGAPGREQAAHTGANSWGPKMSSQNPPLTSRNTPKLPDTPGLTSGHLRAPADNAPIDVLLPLSHSGTAPLFTETPLWLLPIWAPRSMSCYHSLTQKRPPPPAPTLPGHFWTPQKRIKNHTFFCRFGTCAQIVTTIEIMARHQKNVSKTTRFSVVSAHGQCPVTTLSLRNGPPNPG